MADPNPRSIPAQQTSPTVAQHHHSVLDKIVELITDHVLLGIAIAVLSSLGLTFLLEAEHSFEEAVKKTVPLTLAVVLVVRGIRTKQITSYGGFWACLTVALLGAAFFTHMFCHECGELEIQKGIDDMMAKKNGLLSIPLGLLEAYAGIYGTAAFWISVVCGAIVGSGYRKPKPV